MRELQQYCSLTKTLSPQIISSLHLDGADLVHLKQTTLPHPVSSINVTIKLDLFLICILVLKTTIQSIYFSLFHHCLNVATIAKQDRSKVS